VVLTIRLLKSRLSRVHRVWTALARGPDNRRKRELDYGQRKMATNSFQIEGGRDRVEVLKVGNIRQGRCWKLEADINFWGAHQSIESDMER
jgi:hypothetical protein